MSEDAQSAPGTAGRSEQYSLAKILGIWALAPIPMGILGWIVFRCWHPIPGRFLSERASRGWC
jgi:hypothetical protein